MKKLLVVKIGAIGDVIMALPLLNAVWQKYPDCYIDWVCGAKITSILGLVHDPRLNIISIDEELLFNGNKLQKIGEIFKTWMRLGRKFYDRVIVPYYDKRYQLLSKFVKTQETLTYCRATPRPCPILGRHRSAEFCRIALGKKDIGPDDSWPQYPPIQIPVMNQEILDTLNNVKRPIICIAPGGAKNSRRDDGLRRWPVELYAQIAKQLNGKGYSIVLTGGNTDVWVNQYFNEIPCINLIGKTDILQLLSLYSKVQLLITHDSGPLHVADLAGTPVIGIFGPTDPNWSLPIQSKSEILWGGNRMACRPCYDDHDYAKCNDNKCMKETTVEQVISVAEKLLKVNN